MRYHATANGMVPFTAEEERARDADEVRFADETHNRGVKAQIEAIEATTGFTRRQRDFIIANSQTLGAALQSIEGQIAVLRGRLR